MGTALTLLRPEEAHHFKKMRRHLKDDRELPKETIEELELEKYHHEYKVATTPKICIWPHSRLNLLLGSSQQAENRNAGKLQSLMNLSCC